MTDRELVARALRARRVGDNPDVANFAEGMLDHLYFPDADAVLAALADAGRLVPDGHVCIERGRWERVRQFADDAHFVIHDTGPLSFLPPLSNLALTVSDMALMPGDLDEEP